MTSIAPSTHRNKNKVNTFSDIPLSFTVNILFTDEPASNTLVIQIECDLLFRCYACVFEFDVCVVTKTNFSAPGPVSRIPGGTRDIRSEA